MKRIFEGQSNYDADKVEILKNIMLVEENDAQKIYGKTGSGGNGEAWFVGYSEMDRKRKYFAVYLNDNTKTEQISGSKAREIAGKIL